jgi:hypothetical protein
VCSPDTSKPPPGAALIVPAVLAPSPHAICAEKSPTVPPGFASVKWATTAFTACPAVPLTLRPLAVSFASCTAAVNDTVVLPPCSAHV